MEQAQTYLQSINRGLHAAMAQDERVHLLGEDILDPYGGAFKVEKGLSSAFPGRVHTTPISEAASVGVANGMALRGLKPVVAIMFGDFLGLTFDQILNHMVKFTSMYGKPIGLPVVIRTPMGGGRGYGATHSQSLEKYFVGVPGLRVIAPSLAHDPGQLLVDAINQQTPTLFVEHKQLYPLPLFKGSVACSAQPASTGNFETRIVRNFAAGEPDAVIVTYGGVSRLVLDLLEQLASEEIRLSAILPSQIAPLDTAPIEAEVRRCGRVLIAEEGTEGFNWSSEVAAVLGARLFGHLGRPIARLASRAGVIPCSPAGEKAALIGSDDIEAELMKLIA